MNDRGSARGDGRVVRLRLLRELRIGCLTPRRADPALVVRPAGHGRADRQDEQRPERGLRDPRRDADESGELADHAHDAAEFVKPRLMVEAPSTPTRIDSANCVMP